MSFWAKLCWLMGRGGDCFRPKPPMGMGGAAPAVACAASRRLLPSLAVSLRRGRGRVVWLDSASDEFVLTGSANGGEGDPSPECMAGSTMSFRPDVKRLRMGLRGGSGGALSMPFLREAPAGRLTVSMTEVVEMKTGSDISDLAIDFFRSGPAFAMGWGAALGLNAGITGVPGFETGGVLLAENGGTGEP